MGRSDLARLSARDDAGALRVIVESPAGSRVKLKYEPDLGAFTVSRPLVLGVVYPFDWGFVPGTHGPDGDPLACKLSRPHGIFVDADGSVFIGDSENHRVRVIKKP